MKKVEETYIATQQSKSYFSLFIIKSCVFLFAFLFQNIFLFSQGNIIPNTINHSGFSYSTAKFSFNQNNNFKITSFVQDADGYLWLATDKGLGKLIGETLELHNPSYRDIDIESARTIFVLPDSTFLIKNEKRLNQFFTSFDRFNPRTNKFEAIDLSTALGANNFILKILKGPDSTIYIPTYKKKIYRWHYKKGLDLDIIESLNNNASSPPNKLVNNISDGNGIVLFNTWGAFDSKTPYNLTYFGFDGKNSTLPRWNSINSALPKVIGQTKFDYLWINQLVSPNKITCQKITPNKGFVLEQIEIELPFSITDMSLQSIAIDEINKFLIFMDFENKMLFFYDFQGKLKHQVPVPIKRRNADYKFDYFSGLYLFINDFELWGLQILPVPNKIIPNYNHPSTVNKGYRKISSFNNKLNISSSLAMFLARQKKHPFYEPMYRDTFDCELMDFNGVDTFSQTKWVTCNEKIYFRSLNKTKYQAFEVPFNTLGSIWQIHFEETRIWIATNNQGVLLFDKLKRSWKQFFKPNETTYLLKNPIYGLHVIKDSLMLAFGEDNLFTIHPKKGIIEEIEFNNKSFGSLPINSIYHVKIKSDSVFWLATDKGLFSWNFRTYDYIDYFAKSGLIPEKILCVYEDISNRLWMTSYKGIYTYLPQQNIWNHYGSEIDFNVEFNRGSHFQDTTGNLLFGSNFELYLVNPQEISITSDSKKLMTEMIIEFENAERIKIASHQLSKQIIKVPNSSNRIKFELNLVHFLPKNVTYFYKKNKSNQWIQLRDNSLFFSNLQQGAVQLDFKAILLGKEYFLSHSVNLNILPPFYKRTIFVIFEILLVILLIWFFIWRRNRQIIKKNKHLKKAIKDKTYLLEEEKLIVENHAKKIESLLKFKDQLFTKVSHELRTPLTLIKIPIDIIKLQYSTEISEEVQYLLEGLERNVLRLNGLINELSNVVELDDNNQELHLQSVSLGSILINLKYCFKPMAEAKNILFHTTLKIDTTSDEIITNHMKLEKILVNLLINAFKYCPSGSEVELDISTQALKDGTVLINAKVTDNGPGIPEDELNKVSEWFYRGKQGKNTKGKGIGLALSSELARQIGGNLEVKNIPEKGAQFVLSFKCLPYIHSKNPIDQLPKIEPIDVNSTSKVKSSDTIFIVEDNHEMRVWIENLLASYYNVKSFETAEKMLTFFNTLNDKIKSEISADEFPNLIISDIMLPGMNGFELLKALRKNPHLGHIPVIFLTAKSLGTDRNKAFKIGVDDYILKPFNIDYLLTRIENVLERWKIRSQFKNSHLTDTIVEEKKPVPKVKDPWIKLVESTILKNLINPDFDNKALAKILTISERNLYRRTRNISGFSPNQIIRELRMQKAIEMLEDDNNLSISEVAYNSGFDNPGYFSIVFKKHFGKSPRAFQKK